MHVGRGNLARREQPCPHIAAERIAGDQVTERRPILGADDCNPGRKRRFEGGQSNGAHRDACLLQRAASGGRDFRVGLHLNPTQRCVRRRSLRMKRAVEHLHGSLQHRDVAREGADAIE
jgi:hypothetical protein